MAGAYVQSDVAEADSGNLTPSLTGVAAGNCLILAMSYGQRTISSVSSSQDGNFTEGPTDETQTWARVSLWYLENASSGTHTVTISFSGASHYCRAFLGEYSGLETSSVLEDSSAANTGGSSSINSGNVITSQDCTFIGNGTQSDTTVGLSHSFSGHTERYEDTDASRMPISVMEATGVSSGTYSNTFSKASGSHAMATFLAAFKESSGEPPAAAPPNLLTLLGVG